MHIIRWSIDVVDAEVVIDFTGLKCNSLVIVVMVL